MNLTKLGYYCGCRLPFNGRASMIKAMGKLARSSWNEDAQHGAAARLTHNRGAYAGWDRAHDEESLQPASEKTPAKDLTV